MRPSHASVRTVLIGTVALGYFGLLAVWVEWTLQRAVEFMLYATLIAGILILMGIRRWGSDISLARQVILCWVVLSALFAQMLVWNEFTFPFARWSMYSTPTPSTEYVWHRAEYRSGASGHFPFHSVAPSRSARAFASRFSRLARLHPAADENQRRYEELMAELIGIHNRLTPDDPIISVALHSCRLGEDITDRNGIACELLTTVTPLMALGERDER